MPIRNSARERLEKGEVSIGLGVRLARDASTRLLCRQQLRQIDRAGK